MIRVGILIDGSNLIASLYREGLGYPAIAPLIALLANDDMLAYARFYGAPPPREPWRNRWNAFVAANRHVPGLDYFQGYRHASNGEEKCVDVALVTDLLYGKLSNHFDRVAVIGGDGDHVYAFKIAKTVVDLRVFVLGAAPQGLARAHVPFTVLAPHDLLAAGICEAGAGSPVPARHRAQQGTPTTTPILRGSSATPSRRPLS